MIDSAFLELEFLLLVVFSLILPLALYGLMMWKRSISRRTVLLFGVILLLISGVDLFLLRRLSHMAEGSTSTVDDLLFKSEVSVALYLLPALFAGIGVNMISHILIRHLTEAEKRFDREHR